MMLDKLQKIYNDITGTDELVLTTKIKLKDLKLSSLGLIQLVCAIEDEYDIEISNSSLKSFKTVKDVVEYLEKTVG